MPPMEPIAFERAIRSIEGESYANYNPDGEAFKRIGAVRAGLRLPWAGAISSFEAHQVRLRAARTLCGVFFDLLASVAIGVCDVRARDGSERIAADIWGAPRRPDDRNRTTAGAASP
jgi:hypothetical protein